MSMANGAKPLRKLRMLLNGAFSGPQAFFFLAAQRGYLAAAGIEIEFVPVNGAATAMLKMAEGGFDHLLRRHQHPDRTDRRRQGARAVDDSGRSSTRVRSPSRSAPTDRSRCRRIWKAMPSAARERDSALLTFPAFAKRAGVDLGKVEVVATHGGQLDDVRQMIETGRFGGVFGFVNSIIASVAPAGIDGRKALRFFEYCDYAPELYANTVIVDGRLADEEPQIVRGLIAAFNHGLVDLLADLDAGMAAVRAVDPTIDVAIHRARLIGTLRTDMSNPEAAKRGIGDVDDVRLGRSIALIAETRELPRVPAFDEIFRREFLPPLSERVRAVPIDVK